MRYKQILTTISLLELSLKCARQSTILNKNFKRFKYRLDIDIRIERYCQRCVNDTINGRISEARLLFENAH